MAPKTDSESAANLEMTLEGAMASFTLYRLVRHLYIMAEKTRSTQLVMILQMMMPILKEHAQAFLDATQAFSEGKPIGDGFGAMVATKLAGVPAPAGLSSNRSDLKNCALIGNGELSAIVGG